MTAQRFRVWFRKGERVRYISHLDVLRFWERAIRRAGLPLSYSQGFTPHPKLAFASPLPLGFVGEAELVDVTLDERVEPAQFRAMIAKETSDDLALVDIEEIPLTSPSPQAAMLWSEYRLDLPGFDADTARDWIEKFMALESLEWTDERKDKTRVYDLRAAVGEIAVSDADDGTWLEMRLRADAEMTGRPEQVVAAVFPGVQPGVIARTRIILDDSSPALDAWRRSGQYA
ncbi:MAG: TIGR03936 family radical SAM-associated protein [Tepidiformaceae bacterium]